jgi:hypothetical protein
MFIVQLPCSSAIAAPELVMDIFERTGWLHQPPRVAGIDKLLLDPAVYAQSAPTVCDHNL